jgi:hypothetical protein
MKYRQSAARAARGIGAAMAAMALVACGSKGSVSVTATLQNPSMYVDTANNLAGRLNGSFSLYATLGPSAPEGTDVSVGSGNFTLVDVATETPITVLKFLAMPEGPYRLEPGKSFEATFTLNDKGPGQLLSKDEQALLCKTGTTPAISGSITDDSGSVPVSSQKFVIRCP